MKSDCGQRLQEVSFPKRKNIKANIKQIITKFYKQETCIFPRKYYIKSKNHRSQMEAYILKSKFYKAKPKLPEINAHSNTHI